MSCRQVVTGAKIKRNKASENMSTNLLGAKQKKGSRMNGRIRKLEWQAFMS